MNLGDFRRMTDGLSDDLEVHFGDHTSVRTIYANSRILGLDERASHEVLRGKPSDTVLLVIEHEPVV